MILLRASVQPKKTDSTNTALKFMQFDSGNASDSIDLKDLAIKETTDKPEVLKDTSKAEVAVVENKVNPKEQPVDATKKGTTRTKKLRQ